MLLPVLSSGRPVKKTKVHLFLSTMKKVKMKVTQSRLTFFFTSSFKLFGFFIFLAARGLCWGTQASVVAKTTLVL